MKPSPEAGLPGAFAQCLGAPVSVPAFLERSTPGPGRRPALRRRRQDADAPERPGSRFAGCVTTRTLGSVRGFARQNNAEGRAVAGLCLILEHAALLFD